MDYLFEACAILFSVLLPLSIFIVFLRSLIDNLGDPNIITPHSDAPPIE